MRDVVWSLFALGATSYAASGAIYVAYSLKREGARIGLTWAPRLLGIGAVLHFTHLVVDSTVARACPVFSLHAALGLVSVVAVFAYLGLSRGRRLEAVGGFVAAAAVIFLVGAETVAAHPPGPVNRWLLALHITTNLLGLGVLLVAGAASAFYLWQARRLKEKRMLGIGPKLPPLEALDAVVHRLLWIGLPLLTAGIVTGMVVISHAASVSLGEALRAAFSYASWLLVVGVLVLRQAGNWRGRRPAYATLGGSICILIVICLYVGRAIVGGGP
jgi:ABC-type uncharacterized transport system permease subunit